jgi:hypothetical protein
LSVCLSPVWLAMLISESNSSAVVFLVLGCRNVTGELEAVSASAAASVWPHSCLSQFRRLDGGVVADSPFSAIKSSSFAGVVHLVAAIQVYWPKGLSLIAFRRAAVSICPDYHGDLLWLFGSALRILHAILSGLLRGLSLVSGQSAILAPFHSHGIVP